MEIEQKPKNIPIFEQIKDEDWPVFNPKEIYFNPVLGLSLENAPKICIIDDQMSSIEATGRAVCKAGFNFSAFKINNERRDGSFVIKQIYQQIKEKDNFCLFIFDKGLGYVNGIELTRLITEDFPTIMCTGESNTRETHRVANEYIEKPIKDSNLIDMIYSLTGFSPVKS